ncbi:FKBP-type peptidyl-prolyl cis-trans isomerase [Empedobacter brevis]|uniref:FKBP-type peptidyl-prolyl cis-trans isomerase n=1 Tax=Empedobacter brevis TaxID=247 RepID=UPI0039B0AE51
MSIENNNVVSVNYSLHTIEPNGEKVFVEQSNAEEPLTFLVGAGMMIPKFEEELKGLKVGDKKSFIITPAEGYGERVEEAVAKLPLDMFKESGLPPVGALLPLTDDAGNQFRASVVEVTDDAVIADLNPPMAGKTLEFDVEVLNVRPATETEIAHGHAHGIDGNQED